MSPEASPGRTAGQKLSVSAVLVAAGILLSRISGYVRITLFAYVFGVESNAADAFNAGFRICNFLQNLLGEGVLSASLIPVYSRLLSRERQAHADLVARAVLGVLALVTAAGVLIGVIFTPELIPLIAPGYSGAKRALTIRLVRIFFPGVGLLVMSAWCLAILNSHRKFFLSYAAGVLSNAALVTALVLFRHDPLDQVAVKLAWAALVGAALQLSAQLPTVWRIMAAHWSRMTADLRPHVREVLVSSLPIIFSRGVVQVSSYIDTYIATLLPVGALTAFTNASQLYQLPIALFGMAVTAAALPTLSAASAQHDQTELRRSLESGQQMIAVLVVPSVVAFLAIGDVMIALLLEHGRFTHADTIYVAVVLAGSSVGLLATTIARLYANAFYALGDTRTPMRFAVVRVTLVALLGFVLGVIVPRHLGIPLKWGAAGLTISAGLAGWVEFGLLRAALSRRLRFTAISISFLTRIWLVAMAAAAAATVLRWALPPDLRVLRGLIIIGTYGGAYLAIARASGLMAVDELLRRLRRRRA
jgi:putative peptidoglycan lipid II flippase